MADDTILETRGLTKEFKGFVAVSDVDSDRPPRHDPRADRPERRRQDDLLQPAHAFPRRRRAARSSTTAARSPARVRRRIARHGARALVPDLRGVPAPDGARERAHRAAAQAAAHSFDFWRVERRAATQLNAARARADRGGRAWRSSQSHGAVELPYGRKRALEIATTLALDPEMMLLDEPTAGMAHEDVERITALIKQGRRPTARC